MMTVKCSVTKQCLMVFGRETFPVCPFPVCPREQNISFVLVFDERCFVRLDSRVSDMFDAGMHTTLAHRLASIV